MASGTAQGTLPWSWYSHPTGSGRSRSGCFDLAGGERRLTPQGERLLAQFQRPRSEVPA